MNSKFHYRYLLRSGRMISLPFFIWRRLPASRRQIILR